MKTVFLYMFALTLLGGVRGFQGVGFFAMVSVYTPLPPSRGEFGIFNE